MKVDGDSRLGRFLRPFVAGAALMFVFTVWMPLKLVFEGADLEETLWALGRAVGASLAFGLLFAIFPPTRSKSERDRKENGGSRE